MGLGGLRASPPAASLPFPRFPGSASLTRPPHPWAIRSGLPDSRARVPPADASATDSLPAQARGLGVPTEPPAHKAQAAAAAPVPCSSLSSSPLHARAYPERSDATEPRTRLLPAPRRPSTRSAPARSAASRTRDQPRRARPPSYPRSLPAAALRHWRPPRSP